jgi:hypothetical protein
VQGITDITGRPHGVRVTATRATARVVNLAVGAAPSVITFSFLGAIDQRIDERRRRAADIGERRRVDADDHAHHAWQRFDIVLVVGRDRDEPAAVPLDARRDRLRPRAAVLVWQRQRRRAVATLPGADPAAGVDARRLQRDRRDHAADAVQPRGRDRRGGRRDDQRLVVPATARSSTSRTA